MSYEITMILVLLVISWLVLGILDLGVAAILSLAGISFKKAFLYGLLALAIPPMLFAYGAVYERNRYEIKEVDMAFDELSAFFDGYTVVQISDMHLRSFQGRKKALQKMVDAINSLDADMICFTGDLVTMSADEIDGFEPILSQLHAKDGVYSVLGNHDYLLYGKYDEASRAEGVEQIKAKEREMGWTLLLDENMLFRRGADALVVAGVENISASPRFPSRGNLDMALDGTEGCFNILLSHDPTHWRAEVVGRNVPLTLSGHTHAMQFSLFGWCPSKFIFQEYRDLYEAGSQKLYVNVGLGETIFPARIGARPEITRIKLLSNQAAYR